MNTVYYALGLHMHQPPENLELLIETNQWEAQQIIKCYERAARYAHRYKDVARFQVGFSGILLRQFLDKKIIDRYRQIVDIPEMLELYRSAKNIEIIGMGYYHPIFPLIPSEDWPDQLNRGRQVAQQVFGQSPKGFWPSEMAFCMEMIPALAQAGYEYVVVDHVHVKPLKPAARADSLMPYRARYQGSRITVIPRNRDLSNAQESGMDAIWFINEVGNKLKERPNQAMRPLVTTWSDGENGGWFRQMDEAAGFFGYFFAPLMEKIRERSTNIRLVTLSEFLKKYPPVEEAHVATGAWNVASTSGYDFSQWGGSGSQKKAINALFEASRTYWQLKQKEKDLASQAKKNLAAARERLLDAETSCYLFWGDTWIHRIYGKLDQANELLRSVR